MKKIITILAALICINANAQYTKLLDFDSINGSYPTYGSLISDGTFLYGVTKTGGTSNNGVIFKIKTDGTGYTKLLDFGGNAYPYGSFPNNALFYDGTFLYGTTTEGGGTNYIGTLFKIKPDGTAYDTVMKFTQTKGGYPQSTLISDGTFLYGTTSLGSSAGIGNIFKIMPDGTGYDTVMTFNEVNGDAQVGSLLYDGTYLYGMTLYGGPITYCGPSHGCGVAFKIKPDGSGYTKLLNFTGVNGLNPQGSFISIGSFLYGTTTSGGTGSCTSAYGPGCGTIFKIKPDGTAYDTLLNFNVTNGKWPDCSLVYDSTFLYGMTNTGGASDSGTILK